MAQITFENSAKLEQLLSTDAEMKKAMDRIVTAVIIHAQKDAVAAIQIANDPLRAKEAVHTAIYKKCFGGNLNLYPRKRRNGNVTVRSSSRGRMPETERIMRLVGYDRNIVLNILNTGTKERVAEHMDGRETKRESIYQRSGNRVYKSRIIGYRGMVPGRAFFATAAGHAIEKNVGLFQTQIEQEILKIMNSK